jgi:hypothetical protein
MAHHILEILSSSACQAIEQSKLVYTWTSPDEKDKEKDRLTILALVLDQIQPHYKVDMFLEIEKIKKEKLEHYENNPDLFFDTICHHKLLINQKNPLAYTDNQFFQDILRSLKATIFQLHFAWNLNVLRSNGS